MQNDLKALTQIPKLNLICLKAKRKSQQEAEVGVEEGEATTPSMEAKGRLAEVREEAPGNMETKTKATQVPLADCLA